MPRDLDWPFDSTGPSIDFPLLPLFSLPSAYESVMDGQTPLTCPVLETGRIGGYARYPSMALPEFLQSSNTTLQA
ncbi:hypothetical protein CDAR_256291 [Caerostris darwini]|uniref:Uncharacterized protein n=1 Tax=Caerostris darwini TaxID=1538125 RepID=A0AAV4TVF6_9ARAC|nr:hypothetical protein CDAR_256291 [Caerostris darwini]